MLSAIPPSKLEEVYIQKLVQRMVKKSGSFKKEFLEDATHRSMVWMPYYRIRYGYSRSGEGVRKHNVAGQGETALNAMFCGSVESEEEIISLFRPNYLEHETVWTTPQSKEIVGSTAEVDFDGTLNGLLKHLNKVKDELYELRS